MEGYVVYNETWLDSGSVREGWGRWLQTTHTLFSFRPCDMDAGRTESLSPPFLSLLLFINNIIPFFTHYTYTLLPLSHLINFINYNTSILSPAGIPPHSLNCNVRVSENDLVKGRQVKIDKFCTYTQVIKLGS